MRARLHHHPVVQGSSLRRLSHVEVRGFHPRCMRLFDAPVWRGRTATTAERTATSCESAKPPGRRDHSAEWVSNADLRK
jgi:hypothetical protein